MLKVPVINKSNNALPEYATSGSAGFDFCANVDGVNEKFTWNCSLSRNINGKIVEITIYPGGRALIPTGLHMAIPEGYMLAIVTRSGLGLKKGITMANSFGVIDADYRGDIGVIVINHGTEPFTIMAGDRIGQIVLNKVERIEWEEVYNLPDTIRGEGGFGSTGK